MQAAPWKPLPKAQPCGPGQESPSEPQAPSATGATGNLREKAQVAGGQARGPEANRLLTLERSGSVVPAQAGDDATEVPTSHPCPVLELPPAWPLGCGAEDGPAFCFVCFHREEEEELLEEVPLRRSVPRGLGRARAQGSDPGTFSVGHVFSLTAASRSQTLRHLVGTAAFSLALPFVPFLSSPGVPTLLRALHGPPPG